MKNAGWCCWVGLSLVYAAGQGSANAADTPTSTEQRLQTLEDQVQSLRQENLELRRKLGLDPSTNQLAGFLKPTGKAVEAQLGGFVQVRGEFGDPGDARWSGDAANDRFYVRRARLHVQGRFFEQFNYRLQGDYTGVVGEQSGQRFAMTDGWINWNRYDYANLKAGQFFPVYGYEKRLNPLALQAVELALPVVRLQPDRQLGVQVQGGLVDKRVGYTLGLFNGNNLNNNYNDSNGFMVVPRVDAVPLQGSLLGREIQWTVGVGTYYSDDERVNLGPDFRLPGVDYYAGRRFGIALDTQWRWGPLEFVAEYMQIDFDPQMGADYLANGWYVQAGYLVHPKWQAVVKYELYDPNTDLGANTTRTWTFGVNYLIRGTALRASVNYLLMDVPGNSGYQDKVLLQMQAEF
jgi:phosphate-selective porin OprO and OprP